MSITRKRTKFLEEFGDFIVFLQNLWGLLAGISVVFPLSNVFIKIIPLKAYGVDDGVFEFLSPLLITTVATLVTLFVILGTFSNRNTFKENQRRQGIQRQAWISFIIGILALVIYFIIHTMYLNSYDLWQIGSGDPRKLFFEIPLLVAYSAFFALITRAFMLLGMIEFFEYER